MKPILALTRLFAGVALFLSTTSQSQSLLGSWVRRPNIRDTASIELTFKPSQQAEYLFDSFERVSVPYQFRGDTLLLGGTRNTYLGHYHWRMDRDSLRLTVLLDTNRVRRRFANESVWGRKRVSLADDSVKIPPAGPVLVANGNLIDVETGRVRESMSLLIENGIIRKIGKNLAAPAGATVVDARGKWLLPGLIDSHIHLFQSGGLYTRPDGIDLTRYRPYEEERKWLRDNMGDLLRRYLACGITTVIDVGGPMYQFPYCDRFNQQYTSPQILLTGPLISTYQPEAFKIDDSPIIKANTPDEARETGQEAVAL